MAKSRKSSPRYPDRSKRLEARVLAEWLGVPLPTDPHRRVSRAADHLPGLLEELGVEGGIDEEKLKREWLAIAGDFVGKNTSPSRLRDGCLEIAVLQPAMRFHLEQLKAELTRKVRASLGARQVNSIRFVLG